MGKKLTMLRVPIRMLGGVVVAATISAMKFAVIPMIEIRQIPCMVLTTVKVAPRAPNCGPPMITVLKCRSVGY